MNIYRSNARIKCSNNINNNNNIYIYIYIYMVLQIKFNIFMFPNYYFVL